MFLLPLATSFSSAPTQLARQHSDSEEQMLWQSEPLNPIAYCYLNPEERHFQNWKEQQVEVSNDLAWQGSWRTMLRGQKNARTICSA